MSFANKTEKGHCIFTTRAHILLIKHCVIRPNVDVSKAHASHVAMLTKSKATEIKKTPT